MTRIPANDFSSHDYERKVLFRDGKKQPLIVFYGAHGQEVKIDMEKVVRDLHFELPDRESPKLEILLHFQSNGDVYESVLTIEYNETEEG